MSEETREAPEDRAYRVAPRQDTPAWWGDGPAPGSLDAINNGCLCPVQGNAHGKGWALVPGCYWITEGCPVHDREETTDE